MPIFGAAIGSFVGLLVAGVLRKVFPVLDVTAILAGVIAAGCIIGAALEWHNDYGARRN